MKNLLFGLIATVLFSVTGSATNVTGFNNQLKITNVKELQDVKIEFSCGDTKTQITKSFSSQDEMLTFIDAELEKMAKKASSLDNVDEITCSATVHVGVPSNYIEVTVTGPCSEIGAAIKKLKAQLLALL